MRLTWSTTASDSLPVKCQRLASGKTNQEQHIVFLAALIRNGSSEGTVQEVFSIQILDFRDKFLDSTVFH